MIDAMIGRDPDAENVRADLLSVDQMDVLTYCLAVTEWTSAEIRQDVKPVRIAYGDSGEGVHKHCGSSSARYYAHHDDPEWAVIHQPTGDAARGKKLLVDSGIPEANLP